MLKKLISATLIASLVITSSVCVFAKEDNGNHNGWYKNGKLVKDKIEKQVNNGWWYIPPIPYYPTEVTDPASYGEIAKQLKKDKAFYQNEDGEWFAVTNIDGKWYGFSEKGGAPVLVSEGDINTVDYDTYKAMKDGTPSTDTPSDIPPTMHDTGRVTEDGLPIYANDGGILWVYLGDGVFDRYEGGLIDDEPPLPPEEGDIGEPPLPPVVTDESETVEVTSDDVNTGRWTIKGKTTETTNHGVTIVTEGAHVEYNGKDVYQKPEPIENGDTVKIVGKSTEVTKHGRTIVTDGAHYEVVSDMPV